VERIARKEGKRKREAGLFALKHCFPQNENKGVTKIKTIA